jgi:hypothetical protein
MGKAYFAYCVTFGDIAVFIIKDPVLSHVVDTGQFQLVWVKIPR